MVWMRTMNGRTSAALAATVLYLVGGLVGRAEAGLVVSATIDGGGNSTFGSLDLTTGQFTAQSNLPYLVLGMTTGPDGTSYQGASDGNLYAVPPGGTPTAIASGPINSAYFGLAAVGSEIDGFTGMSSINFAISVVSRFSAGGQQFDSHAVEPQPNGVASGAMALGPDGSLYAEFSPTVDSEPGVSGPGPFQLFRLDPTTGVVSPIGSSLGAANGDALSLVTAGGMLYGIDTFASSGDAPIGIYTINTTTGVATDTGVVVTGLPDGFFLDTAASSPAAIPEPSSLLLSVLGGLLIVIWRSGRVACARLGSLHA